MYLGKLMFKILELEVVGPYRQPKACKRQMREKLQKFYSESFLESLNIDHMIGYYEAIQIAKEMAGNYYAKSDSEQNVTATMLEQLYTFYTYEKPLKELLTEFEYDEDFIDEISADIEFGFKLGFEVLDIMMSDYLQKLKEPA